MTTNSILFLSGVTIKRAHYYVEIMQDSTVNKRRNQEVYSYCWQHRELEYDD